MSCWGTQRHPCITCIVSGVDLPCVTESPASPFSTEHRAHENRIDVEAFDLDPFPVLSAIGGFHQVRARLFFVFMVIDVVFAAQPAVLVIDEKDVAHDVFGRRTARGPGVTTIACLQHYAFAADYPATVLIKKEDSMKPRHCSATLTRPGAALG